MCRSLQGQNRYIFDPLGTATAGGDWGVAPEFIYRDEEQFLDLCYSEKTPPGHFFVDEAHRIFGHQMRENFWMLTEGRHYGMIFHLITQRPNKLHPDVRDQTGKCFMFRLAVDDAKAIGADYGFSDTHKLFLDKGDFLELNSGSSAMARGNVFNLLKGT